MSGPVKKRVKGYMASYEASLSRLEDAKRAAGYACRTMLAVRFAPSPTFQRNGPVRPAATPPGCGATTWNEP